MVTLLCVAGEGGDPLIQIHTDSQECSKCASKQDLDNLEAKDVQTQKYLDVHAQNTEDILAVMKAIMEKVLNNTGNISSGLT